MSRTIHIPHLILGVTLLMCLGTQLKSQEPSLTEVLSSSPSRANSILFADIPSIRALTSGSMMHADFPDGMGEVRVVADLNLKPLQPKWEIGLVTFKNLKSAETLAKSVKGYVDTMGGKNVVWSPRQSYLIPMENNVLGIVRPTDRKLVGRWLSKETNNGTSAYLKKHAMQATKFLSLMLAVDLEDTWSSLAIESRIAKFESLKGMDVKANSKLLSSVLGIQILVGRKNLDECIISLDFASSPSSLLPVAKAFFIELLSHTNSSVPEASKWTASVDGNTLAFRGTITAETIDHLVGIFTLQDQAARLPSELEPLQDSTSESALLEINKQYFAKTTNFIKRVREYSASNTGDRAQWNGQIARRIDDLPTLNVDPELVDFGVRVAQGLRGNMVAMQQTNIQVGAAAVVNGAGGPQVGYYSGYNGVGYGGGYYANDSNSTGQYQAVAQATGNYSYRELISQIDAMEAEIRRKMTSKYKVQF